MPTDHAYAGRRRNQAAFTTRSLTMGFLVAATTFVRRSLPDVRKDFKAARAARKLAKTLNQDICIPMFGARNTTP